MMNSHSRPLGVASANVGAGTGLSVGRFDVMAADVLDDAVVTAEQIAAGNKVRGLRHELQLALLELNQSACTAAESLATPADISWVQDQVIERPYMAQVVNRWFRSARQLSQGQVQALRMVAQLVIRIEELAPVEERALARYRAAVTPAVHSGV